MAGTEKLCGICGEDCADRPRTRDFRGRYFCKACYEQRREQERVTRGSASRPTPVQRTPTAPPPIAAPPAAAPGEIGLEPLPTGGPASPPPRGMVAPAPPRLCQACGRVMDQRAVICTACGFDARTGRHVDAATAAAAAPPLVRERAHWFLAPVYLFVRPSRFYQLFVVDPAPLLTAFFAWLYGMAGVMDRIDSRAAMSQLGGRTSTLPDHWGVHWAMIGLGGIVAGLLYMVIGGWWYRVRLRWSGVAQPEWPMVRRVYLTASAVFALPAVLWRAAQTGLYARPSDAFNADFNVFDGLVMLALFWSIWISYVGVRAVFNAARWRAAVWFLILPLTLYGIAFGGIAALSLLVLSAPPDTSSPATHRAARFTFQYPSNWRIDTSDSSYDPQGDLFIDALQDASVHVMFYESQSSAEEELRATLDLVRMSMIGPQNRGEFSEWGTHRGVGRIIAGRMNGVAVTFRVFVSAVDEQTFLEIAEVSADADHATVEPGFQLIRTSLTAR